MSPFLILTIFLFYTIVLFSVTWFTARKADNQSFYIGNKVSPWFVVAYGMIGASLSGVTFMSVPGWVKDTQFSYMVVVLGYLFGYFVIALVLLPLYYRLKLTSIYSYLDQRFGFWSYKTGAGFFPNRPARSNPPGSRAPLPARSGFLSPAVRKRWPARVSGNRARRRRG